MQLGKCFPLTNFPNGKQTHESLESGFPETTWVVISGGLDADDIDDIMNEGDDDGNN